MINTNKTRYLEEFCNECKHDLLFMETHRLQHNALPPEGAQRSLMAKSRWDPAVDPLFTIA